METNLNHLADTLEYSCGAEVELSGGQIISIWYTAWPQIRNDSKILSISSDYPRIVKHPAFIIN